MSTSVSELVFPYRDTTFHEFAQANKMTLGQAAKALEKLHKENRLEVTKNRNGNYVYRNASVSSL